MENKLITLFKQCCDNPEFIKAHPCSHFQRPDINYPLSEQPFEMSDNHKDLIAKGGYTVKDVGTDYTSVSYGRLFEFDGEPPLKLVRASVRLTLLMGAKHIKLGDVKKLTYIKKNEKWKGSTFWRESRTIKYDTKHDFLSRTVEIDKGIRDANHAIWKQNQTDESFSFPPRSAHRYEKPNMIIVSQSYKRNDASNFWFRDDLDIMESAHYDSDMGDYNKVLSGIQHDHMDINGAILSFGDVWLWLDFDAYQELDKYYKDSIKRTHEVILEQRLNETKNEND